MKDIGYIFIILIKQILKHMDIAEMKTVADFYMTSFICITLLSAVMADEAASWLSRWKPSQFGFFLRKLKSTLLEQTAQKVNFSETIAIIQSTLFYHKITRQNKEQVC